MHTVEQKSAASAVIVSDGSYVSPTKRTFTLPGASVLSKVTPLTVSIIVVAGVAFIVRILLITQQSAYMDEGSEILAGRTLIEQHHQYADVLSWNYGSYLWPLIAGAADILGGLTLVRTLTTIFGTVTSVMTALAAYRLAPHSAKSPPAWVVGLAAGLIMALFPTAIGLGRFGTYDGLAVMAFSIGITLLIPQPRSKQALLAAAVFLFIAFLAKYVVAIYFPFICLYLIFGSRKRAIGAFQFIWFVLPLSLLCTLYFGVFHTNLLNLLSYSSGYSDLKSSNLLQEYIWQRPELWVLLFIAVLGLEHASTRSRLFTLGIALPIILFQAIARPDFDFWKHSVYLIFALAPLAALPVAGIVQGFIGTRDQLHHSHSQQFLLLLGGILLGVAAFASERQADTLVTFYPNINPAVSQIQTQTTRSQFVLTDDIAVRYYLYPHMPTERVFSPFFPDYKGRHDTNAIHDAIADRYYDTIILDGGIGPIAQQIRANDEDLIYQYYRQVYSGNGGHGELIEIFQKRQGTIAPSSQSAASQPGAYTFDITSRGWGGHADNSNLQPGWHTQVNTAIKAPNGHAVLAFQADSQVSLLAVRHTGTVHKVTALVYLAGPPTAKTHVGMVGFDGNWNWRDDGFKQVITGGQWTTLTWNLAQPGEYNEIGLKFADLPQSVYIGQVTISP